MQSKKNHENHIPLPGIGKQMTRHLARLDIHSIKDLLLHLPSRYQDRTLIQPIRYVSEGSEVLIEGTITSISNATRGRTKLLCELKDGTGKFFLRFFNVLAFQKTFLIPGTALRCFGEVRLGPRGLEMIHPDMQVIVEGRAPSVDPYLTPIYPATEGLSQYMLRKLTAHALKWLDEAPHFKELLPDTILNSLQFPTIQDALKAVHRPPRETSIEALQANVTPAQKRLIFEELLAHRMSLLRVKHDFQLQAGVPLLKKGTLIDSLIKQLPFKLTQAQKRVSEEIAIDLRRASPMLRLVQGDVGSGKTVIAAIALLQAVENGYQAAMMAPTELLAEQHYRNLTEFFAPLGVNIVFLSGHIKGKKRRDVLAAIASGNAQVMIGTHALFQKEVRFHHLALVVTDEQHRFGVHQRARFREKGIHAQGYPHQLMMTATPIPRTLAMSFYADLDCSTLDEMPPGRMPIVTSVVMSKRRGEIAERIRIACKEGKQAYWVCPLIEESELLHCQSTTKIAQELQSLLPELNIGLIHGRLKPDQKESVMRAFQLGEIALLVATTVIEVGVDVANAAIMVIENAERLGLSQLHQLRGRVGRGKLASHCILLYDYPLSAIGKERLAVMRETTDGFKIAQRDLELRGPGEVLGTRQTGDFSFYAADLLRDNTLLPAVHEAADHILKNHPHLIDPLIERWLGEGKDYAKV